MFTCARLCQHADKYIKRKAWESFSIAHTQKGSQKHCNNFTTELNCTNFIREDTKKVDIVLVVAQGKSVAASVLDATIAGSSFDILCCLSRNPLSCEP